QGGPVGRRRVSHRPAAGRLVYCNDPRDCAGPAGCSGGAGAADRAGAADYNRPTRAWRTDLRLAGRGGFTESQVSLLAAKEIGMRKGLTRAATCLLCGLLFGAVGC